MTALDSVVSANNAIQNQDLRQVPQEVSNGINEKMKLLHEVIFNGTLTNIFMAILLFIVTTILELVPFLSKYFYDVSEYFERAKAARELKNKFAQLETEKEMKLMAEKAVFELQAGQALLVNNYRLDKLHDEILYDRSIIDETERQIEFLEESKRRTKEKHPEYYDSHIDPIVQRSFENLREISNESISQ